MILILILVLGGRTSFSVCLPSKPGRGSAFLPRSKAAPVCLTFTIGSHSDAEEKRQGRCSQSKVSQAVLAAHEGKATNKFITENRMIPLWPSFGQSSTKKRVIALSAECFPRFLKGVLFVFVWFRVFCLVCCPYLSIQLKSSNHNHPLLALDHWGVMQ